MRANIYIRKENEKKWENIPDKSNWVNTLLDNSDDTSKYGVVRNSPIGPIVEVLSEDVWPEKNNDLADAKVNERYSRQGDLRAGEDRVVELGMACCVSTSARCKHWVWNDNTVSYMNSITGELRDAE